LWTVPSSEPKLTSVIAPSPTTISVAWQPPVYANGPLLSYRLSLHAVASEDREASVDVPPERTSWLFGQLFAGGRYEVRILAVNVDGDGPVAIAMVTTPTPGNCEFSPNFSLF